MTRNLLGRVRKLEEAIAPRRAFFSVFDDGLSPVELEAEKASTGHESGRLSWVARVAWVTHFPVLPTSKFVPHTRLREGLETKPPSPPSPPKETHRWSVRMVVLADLIRPLHVRPLARSAWFRQRPANAPDAEGRQVVRCVSGAARPELRG